MSGPDAPGPELRFGTIAAAGDRLAVYLVGDVDARVDTVGGLTLSGAHAAIGTDRLLPRPTSPVVLSLDGGEVRADPADVHDLRAGIVPGAGVVLRPVGFAYDALDSAEDGAAAGHEWFDTGEGPSDPFADPPRAPGVPAQRALGAATGGRNGATRASGPEATVEADEPEDAPTAAGPPEWTRGPDAGWGAEPGEVWAGASFDGPATGPSARADDDVVGGPRSGVDAGPQVRADGGLVGGPRSGVDAGPEVRSDRGLGTGPGARSDTGSSARSEDGRGDGPSAGPGGGPDIGRDAGPSVRSTVGPGGGSEEGLRPGPTAVSGDGPDRGMDAGPSARPDGREAADPLIDAPAGRHALETPALPGPARTARADPLTDPMANTPTDPPGAQAPPPDIGAAELFAGDPLAADHPHRGDPRAVAAERADRDTGGLHVLHPRAVDDASADPLPDGRPADSFVTDSSAGAPAAETRPAADSPYGPPSASADVASTPAPQEQPRGRPFARRRDPAFVDPFSPPADPGSAAPARHELEETDASPSYSPRAGTERGSVFADWQADAEPAPSPTGDEVGNGAEPRGAASTGRRESSSLGLPRAGALPGPSPSATPAGAAEESSAASLFAPVRQPTQEPTHGSTGDARVDPAAGPVAPGGFASPHDRAPGPTRPPPTASPAQEPLAPPPRPATPPGRPPSSPDRAAPPPDSATSSPGFGAPSPDAPQPPGLDAPTPDAAAPPSDLSASPFGHAPPSHGVPTPDPAASTPDLSTPSPTHAPLSPGTAPRGADALVPGTAPRGADALSPVAPTRGAEGLPPDAASPSPDDAAPAPDAAPELGAAAPAAGPAAPAQGFATPPPDVLGRAASPPDDQARRAGPPSAAEVDAATPGSLILSGQVAPPEPPLRTPTPDAEGPPSSRRGPRIRGYRCQDGHLNDPRSPSCRECGAPIDERVGGLVTGPRPVLGTLLFDDGAAHLVDGGYLVGRAPDADDRVRTGELRPIAIDDQAGSVSHAHAEIRVSGWDVMVVDTGSGNGTYVSGPDEGQWTALPPRRSRRLLPGTRVRLGARMFVFESSSTVR